MALLMLVIVSCLNGLVRLSWGICFPYWGLFLVMQCTWSTTRRLVANGAVLSSGFSAMSTNNVHIYVPLSGDCYKDVPIDLHTKIHDRLKYCIFAILSDFAWSFINNWGRILKSILLLSCADWRWIRLSAGDWPMDTDLSVKNSSGSVTDDTGNADLTDMALHPPMLHDLQALYSVRPLTFLVLLASKFAIEYAGWMGTNKPANIRCETKVRIYSHEMWMSIATD